MVDTTISLDGISSSTIPELVIENVSRQITPGIRDSYRDVPGRSGSLLFTEAAGDRSISVRFAAVGDDSATRRVAVREAAALVYGDGLGRRKLVVSDETDRFYWAKLAAPILAEELLARGRFDVDFRTSPYALATAISTDTVVGNGSIVIAVAPGFASFFEPSIEVEANVSLAGGFTLDVDGRAIVYSGAMALGAKVTISTISTTVTTGADGDAELDGTFVGADLAMTSVSGDFPLLTAGTNTVTATGAITSVFRWRERYV
jgi:phage-related protein